MSRLRIRHETTYAYQAPVNFGPWRLLMRPADTHSMRVLEASFELFPTGQTRWTYDPYSNSVCHFTPNGPNDRLTVVNNLLIERYPAPLAPLDMDDPRSLSPIVYDAAARIALAPFITPAPDDVEIGFHEWLRAHANHIDEPALDYVMRLNRAIHQDFRYTARNEYGTQAPATTASSGSGACRDLAWLMIETLRHLGFAARFVTGYIHASNVGGGATHAWCEVFLPDLGWIECDPTNGLVESDNLIRVASTRTPGEASPMEGVVLNDPGGSVMTVTVDVHFEQPQASWTF